MSNFDLLYGYGLSTGGRKNYFSGRMENLEIDDTLTVANVNIGNLTVTTLNAGTGFFSNSLSVSGTGYFYGDLITKYQKPLANNEYAIGSTSLRYATGYINNIVLSNPGGGTSVPLKDCSQQDVTLTAFGPIQNTTVTARVTRIGNLVNVFLPGLTHAGTGAEAGLSFTPTLPFTGALDSGGAYYPLSIQNNGYTGPGYLKLSASGGLTIGRTLSPSGPHFVTFESTSNNVGYSPLCFSYPTYSS